MSFDSVLTGGEIKRCQNFAPFHSNGIIRSPLSPAKAKEALLVGFFQAASILPGISRSGATITGGLVAGLKPPAAFLFSFFLAVPAIVGAALLQLPQIQQLDLSFWIFGLIGMIIAGGVGYVSLLTLERVLREAKLWTFAFYTFALGLLVLLFSFFNKNPT